MLDMTREALPKSSEVAQATIADLKTGRRQPYPRTLAAIRATLESAGVEFIEQNGGGRVCGYVSAELGETLDNQARIL